MKTSLKEGRNVRRRAHERGFTNTPQIFEVAMVVTWFAVTIAGAKYLDTTITQRRAAENAAQDSVRTSASPCQNAPVETELGAIGATSTVNRAAIDRLGLEAALLPPVPTVGVSYEHAFPTQRTPLRHMSSDALSSWTQTEDTPSGGTSERVQRVGAGRRLNCQDVPQEAPTPAPYVKSLSQTIWTRKIMGY